MVGRKVVAALALLSLVVLSGCAGSPPAPRPASGDVVPVLDASVGDEADAQPDEAQASGEPSADPQPSDPQPSSPQAQPQQPQQPAPAAQANQTVTEVYDPKYDILLDENYLPAGVPTAYTFDVAPGYDVLDVFGHYVVPGSAFYLVETDLSLKDGDGKEVAHYSGTPDGYAEFYFGGSTVSFSIALLQHPAPGKYTMTVSSAGSETGFAVRAVGEAGGAPDFPYTDVTIGTDHHLHELRGKAVILDLMATWCGPCQQAMPGLGRIQADYGDKVAVVSISMDPADTPAMIQDMKEKYGGPWTFAYDAQGTAREHYDAGLFPSYAVVDIHNNLIFRSTSASEADLRHWVDIGLAA